MTITQEMEDEIVRLFDSGMSVPKISAKLHVSYGAIYPHLSKHGRKFQSKSHKVFPTKEQRNQILGCHQQGMSNPEIAATVGLPYYSVRSFVKKHGLTSNKWAKAAPVVRDGLMYCETCHGWKKPNDFRQYVGWTGKVRFYKARMCKACCLAHDVARINANSDLYFQRLAAGLYRAAVLKGLPYDIDAQYLAELCANQQSKCFYTDQPIECRKRPHVDRQQSLSVDKVIPQRGYVLGNIVLTTVRINTMKYNATLDELRQWMPDWHARIIRCPWLLVT